MISLSLALCAYCCMRSSGQQGTKCAHNPGGGGGGGGGESHMKQKGMLLGNFEEANLGVA